MKKILICSNYAWTIFNFRLPLMEFLKNSGCNVSFLTQFDGYEEKIANHGFNGHHLFISRSGLNPFWDLITILHLLINLITRFKSTTPIFFSIKPVIYGSLVCRLLKRECIVMITGLGTAFLNDGFLQKVAIFLYKISLKSAKRVIFQNHDDKNIFLKHNLVTLSQVIITPGSGIDLDKFSFRKINIPAQHEAVFLMISRIISDKGIYEYCEAAAILKNKYPGVKFNIVGPLDVKNRTALSSKEFYDLIRKAGNIFYHGETDDIFPFIEESTCVVLPSYREGTSRVLLEAGAIGRPLIASNVTGCKEVILNAKNGFLCTPKDAVSLANAIEKIINLPSQELEKFSLASRKMITDKYDQKIVFEIFREIINA